MKCPICGSLDSRVLDSRPVEDGAAIRRRRECGQCLRRFTTYEKSEEAATPYVIKKDGRREPFDRHKMRSGLIKACEKRPVALSSIDEMVADIERKLQNSPAQEIPSGQLGELVMERLRQLDEIAYVRFASVYRQFKDINTFMEELNKLLTER